MKMNKFDVEELAMVLDGTYDNEIEIPNLWDEPQIIDTRRIEISIDSDE